MLIRALVALAATAKVYGSYGGSSGYGHQYSHGSYGDYYPYGYYGGYQSVYPSHNYGYYGHPYGEVYGYGGYPYVSFGGYQGAYPHSYYGGFANGQFAGYHPYDSYNSQPILPYYDYQFDHPYSHYGGYQYGHQFGHHGGLQYGGYPYGNYYGHPYGLQAGYGYGYPYESQYGYGYASPLGSYGKNSAYGSNKLYGNSFNNDNYRLSVQNIVNHGHQNDLNIGDNINTYDAGTNQYNLDTAAKAQLYEKFGVRPSKYTNKARKGNTEEINEVSASKVDDDVESENEESDAEHDAE
nr:prisilkin-39-like isoform X13 [Lepeophtheirus salmonis]